MQHQAVNLCISAVKLTWRPQRLLLEENRKPERKRCRDPQHGHRLVETKESIIQRRFDPNNVSVFTNCQISKEEQTGRVKLREMTVMYVHFSFLFVPPNKPTHSRNNPAETTSFINCVRKYNKLQ